MPRAEYSGQWPVVTTAAHQTLTYSCKDTPVTVAPWTTLHAVPSQAAGSSSALLGSAPPNRLDLVFVGDGYRNPQLDTYALVALTPDVIAEYRDARLGAGKAPGTVRLELTLLPHLFTTAIRERHLGLLYIPVMTVRKPSLPAG